MSKRGESGMNEKSKKAHAYERSKLPERSLFFTRYRKPMFFYCFPFIPSICVRATAHFPFCIYVV